MSAFEKVRNYIEKYNMIEKDDSVIVGISGGADSVCLLMMFLEMQQFIPFHIIAVHVHHGIRGEEADRDEEFVKTLCEGKKVLLQVFHYNVPLYAKENGLSEEEAGRILRYKTFRDIAKKMGNKNIKIAVAHNLNDSTETFIHNLCRGTGVKGLSGITPCEAGIIRPLLCLERMDIEKYLNEKGVSYITDSTNLNEEYTRNKIRLQVLPYLNKNINKNSMQHIYQASLQLREAEDYLEKCTDEIYGRVVCCEYEKSENQSNKQLSNQSNNKIEGQSGNLPVEKIKIKLNEFRQLDHYIQSRIVRKAIYHITGRLKDITLQHIQDVLGLMDKPVGKYISLPYNLNIEKGYNSINFLNKLRYEENTDNDVLLDLSQPGTYISLLDHATYVVEIIDVDADLINIKNLEKTLKYSQNMYTKWFDYDKIKFTVQLRNRRSGDFIVIDDEGSRKKLKSYFIDQKIPRQDREKVPLIADGSNIIWIVGHRINNDYKITSHTKKIIKIERKDTTKDGE